MKNFVIMLLVVGSAIASPVTALAQGWLGQKTGLTVTQSIQLLNSLRALDGRSVIVKVSGNDQVVAQPYSFSSGSIRLAIAQNIATLEQSFLASEKARLAIINEVGKGKAIEAATPAMDEFLRKYQQMMDSPAVLSSPLARIKADDLRLDANEIPGSVVSGLLPILDK